MEVLSRIERSSQRNCIKLPADAHDANVVCGIVRQGYIS